MSVTLLLPGALVPREVARALAEPVAATALASLLSKSELLGDTEADGLPHLAWLAERLFARATPLATAPYAYAELAGRAPDSDVFLWHADPVHLELARDHLVLAPLAEPPDDAEAAALLAAANALAAEAGAEFVRVQDRWFLRAALPWDLDTPPLAAALGRPLEGARPAGRDAARWNRLLTEVQMAWHTHPVNEAREARGGRSVNSLWLHGGGCWEALPRAAWSALHADAPEWRGAARAAGIAVASADAAPADDALVVWSDLLAPHRLQDWTAWTEALRGLDRRLAALARTAPLELVLTGDTTVRRLRTRPSDRLKFWRAMSCEQVFSE